MNTSDFVILTFLAHDGEIKGKTTLQKKIYFLGLLTEKIEELGYRPHFYGPYSEDVALAVEDLKTVGFIDQNVVSIFGTTEAGFERRRYDYRLTEAGRIAAEKTREAAKEEWTRINSALDNLRSAGNLDYMRLSIAAKTFFLLGQERGTANRSQLAKLAPQFGWRVSEGQIGEAANYLNRVGLVEVSD